MKVEYVFDPFELSGLDSGVLTAEKRKEVLEDVKAYVLESVLLDVASSVSPVTGRPFKKLSPEYKKKKLSELGVGDADLVFSGDMLDSLIVKSTSGTKLKLTVGSGQQDKADGHNNHSGSSQLPERKFIPISGEETFSDEIMSGIEEIVRDAIEEANDN